MFFFFYLSRKLVAKSQDTTKPRIIFKSDVELALVWARRAQTKVGSSSLGPSLASEPSLGPQNCEKGAKFGTKKKVRKPALALQRSKY